MPNTGVVTELEVAQLRRESDDYMPDHVRVHVRTASRTSSGGTTYSIGTNPVITTRGRLSPMSKSVEAFYADRLGGRQGWTITVPEDANTAVAALTSVLKVGTRIFEVFGSDRGRSYRLTRMYDCMELT